MVNGCRHGGGKVNSNRMDSYTDKFDVSIFLESFYYCLIHVGTRTMD